MWSLLVKARHGSAMAVISGALSAAVKPGRARPVAQRGLTAARSCTVSGQRLAGRRAVMVVAGCVLASIGGVAVVSGNAAAAGWQGSVFPGVVGSDLGEYRIVSGIAVPAYSALRWEMAGRSDALAASVTDGWTCNDGSHNQEVLPAHSYDVTGELSSRSYSRTCGFALLLTAPGQQVVSVLQWVITSPAFSPTPSEDPSGPPSPSPSCSSGEALILGVCVGLAAPTASHIYRWDCGQLFATANYCSPETLGLDTYGAPEAGHLLYVQYRVMLDASSGDWPVVNALTLKQVQVYEGGIDNAHSLDYVPSWQVDLVHPMGSGYGPSYGPSLCMDETMWSETPLAGDGDCHVDSFHTTNTDISIGQVGVGFFAESENWGSEATVAANGGDTLAGHAMGVLVWGVVLRHIQVTVVDYGLWHPGMIMPMPGALPPVEDVHAGGGGAGSTGTACSGAPGPLSGQCKNEIKANTPYADCSVTDLPCLFGNVLIGLGNVANTVINALVDLVFPSRLFWQRVSDANAAGQGFLPPWVLHLFDVANVATGSSGVSYVWTIGPPVNASVDLAAVFAGAMSHMAPLRPLLAGGVYFCFGCFLLRWLPSQILRMPR